MLSEFFDSLVRIHKLGAGPVGALFEGFAQELSKAGYAEITARRHIRAAEHFTYWADRKGMLVCSLNEQSLERFDRHLGRCRCPRYGHADRLNVLNGARLFLRHLRDAGVITASPRTNRSRSVSPDSILPVDAPAAWHL